MEKKNILIEDCKDTFNSCLQTMIKKNNDYAGENAVDVFKNFRACSLIGVSPAKGILTRMMDKMVRVGNLMNQEAAVNESIDDTLDDLINYAAILKSVLKNNIK